MLFPEYGLSFPEYGLSDSELKDEYCKNEVKPNKRRKNIKRFEKSRLKICNCQINIVYLQCVNQGFHPKETKQKLFINFDNEKV
ncbi:MAG: hypothetical protein KBT20_08155 [Bacteroidales bacterium]|nr:hypothetical protein [Candidatus Liminaster caballi]